jgi:pyruvate,orthophosphate dikinase
MTDELSLLQTIRLKGRVSLDALVLTLGSDRRSVEASVSQSVSAGLVAVAGKGFKLTPAGRERLAALLAAEQASLDAVMLEKLYGEFDGYNTALKEIVTAWQMKGPDTPNDHTDAAYDAAIVADLADLHHRFVPWLERLAAVAPRLSRYTTRFDTAIGAVQRGDRGFIAKPLADSYHTVWFELHEELLGVVGRDRGSEAAAGRAL